MKKILALIVLVIVLTGCADSKPTLNVNDMDRVTKIKGFDHLYITNQSFSNDWVVWITIGLEGNSIRLEGRDRILQKALSAAVKKSGPISNCISTTK